VEHKYNFLLILLVFFLSCTTGHDRYTEVTVIKNSIIVDGSGGPAYRADVYFTNEEIIAIDSTNDSEIKTILEIDGDNRILAPGFIDLHTHGDPLADQKDFNNFLAQGVTTICLGMDGFSNKSIMGWINSLKFEDIPLNVVPFVGHSTLREISGIGYDILPDTSQITDMQQLLNEAMQAGYFGLTLGLEYRPGGLARGAELLALAKTTGESDGIIMSHIRNEDDDAIVNSLEELIDLGQYCPVHVSHIKVVYGKGRARALEIRKQLESARDKAIIISADWYPYTASYTGIGIVFPDWAKRPNDYKEVKSLRREDLARYLEHRVMKRNGPEAMIFGTAPWAGLTLKQAAEAAQKPYVDVLIDDVGPYGASGAYFIMDEELQATLLLDTLTALASDGSPTMHHPRGYGSNARMIEKIVLSDSLLSIEQAIRKMSGLPADILSLKNRGYIRVGFKSDLVLFHPQNIEERASFAKPHELATGFDFVFVNGQAVVNDGEFSDGFYGRLLENEK